MNGKVILLGLVAALLLLPVMPNALAAGGITIDTNSKFYKPGDAVTISGTTMSSTVYVSVNDTQGVVLPGATVAVSSGKYTVSFNLADDAYIGVYRAKANDGTEKATIAFTVSDITPTDLAGNMIKLAEDAQARTEKLFQELEAQKVTLLPVAQKNHDQGVTELDNAKSLLSQGHPWEALAAARDSMINFRNAIWDAWRSAKVDKVEDKTADVLTAAIQRGRDVALKLGDTIDALAKDGRDVNKATADLADAKAQLDAAEASVQANKLVDAGKQVDAAKSDLQKVLVDLKPLASTLAHEGVLKFLNSAEFRVDNLEAQLRRLSNANNVAHFNAAEARLELAKGKISEAIALLRNGRNDASLAALQAANNEINVGIGNIDSGKNSANLNNINMLQAKIQFLQRTEEKIKKWGMDTKAIQSQIDALQAQLAQAQQTTTP